MHRMNNVLWLGYKGCGRRRVLEHESRKVYGGQVVEGFECQVLSVAGSCGRAIRGAWMEVKVREWDVMMKGSRQC